MTNLALYGDGDDSENFGTFSSADLQQFETVANDLGLTTTAFHSIEAVSTEWNPSPVLDEQTWVSAHDANEDPLENYAFKAYNIKSFETQAQHWAGNLDGDAPESAEFGGQSFTYSDAPEPVRSEIEHFAHGTDISPQELFQSAIGDLSNPLYDYGNVQPGTGEFWDSVVNAADINASHYYGGQP